MRSNSFPARCALVRALFVVTGIDDAGDIVGYGNIDGEPHSWMAMREAD